MIGGNGLTLPIAEEQTTEAYETVEKMLIKKSGHWTSEENPVDVEKMRGHVGKHD